MPYAGKRHVLSGNAFGSGLTTSTSTRESAFGDLSTRRLLKQLDVSDLTLGVANGLPSGWTAPTVPLHHLRNVARGGQTRLAHMRQLCLDVLGQSSDYLGQIAAEE